MRKEIITIPLDRLSVSPLNVRRHGEKDVASLARTIAERGVLNLLLVRPVGDDKASRRKPQSYEIVAGRRRFLALQKVKAEAAPCVVLDAGDDAAAIEASIIENAERMPLDEIDAYDAFAALAAQGRSEKDIAWLFSVPVAQVRQRLALANLIPEAKARYRAGEIDTATLRMMTLGTRERQKAYLKLIDDPDQTPPPAWQLRQWMLGGTEIDARNALFPLDQYPAPIATDLFGEAAFCTDADAFWTLQRQAVEAEADKLRANGWKAVHIFAPDVAFSLHQWEPATKAQGGNVAIKLHADGRVQIEKGLISRDEARRAKKAAQASTAAPANGSASPCANATPTAPTATATSGPMKVDAEGNLPEMSAALKNYVDLVRHSAVCAGLLRKPKIALRVLAASLIAGARNIHATADRRSALAPEIAKSVADMTSEAEQQRARAAVIAALDLPRDRGLFGAAGDVTGETAAILAKLIDMTDAQVTAILALATTESLAVGSRLVDALGEELAVDVTEHWQADATLLALANRRPVIAAIADEVLGDEAPRAHAMTLNGARAVIAESLKKSKLKWQPRWTEFPARRYIERAAETA